MATLLVSGDSWTSCWPLEEKLGHRKLGWPNLVATYFDFELVDKSRAGSSNYRIFRKAFNGLLDNPSLAIVCLTSWVRFETGGSYGNKPGSIYQHMPNHNDSDQAFKLFFNGYKNYIDMLQQVISLQALAKVKNIPCFFLDTFNNNLYRNISIDQFKNVLSHNIIVFDSKSDSEITKKFDTVKLLESNVDWTMFISANSYESLIDGCNMDKFHPVEDGHAKIAKVIIKFLESINHGKTI